VAGLRPHLAVQPAGAAPQRRQLLRPRTTAANRLIYVGAGASGGAAAAGSDSKDAEAPWDAAGRPRALPKLAGGGKP
jgi:hypothetical protein